MLFSVSAVVFFGLFLGLMLKTKSLRAGGCLVATLFGFYLASTGAAVPINQFTSDMASFVVGLGR